MKNPKEKGNGFERKVAKMFSDWAGVKFMRTPMSGAIHNFKDQRVVSDIVAPLSIGKWPFSVECKKVETSWEFNTLLEDTSLTLKAHWIQCCTDAEREGVTPFLVFNKNYRDIYVMVHKSTYEILNLDIDYMEINTKKAHVVVFKFKDFLYNVSLDELLKREFKEF